MSWSDITRLEKAGMLGESMPTASIDKPSTSVFIQDTHGRFIDPQAWSIVTQILGDIEFDRVIWNGDLLDFYELSKYEKDPDETRSITEDRDAWLKCLLEVQALNPDARHDFVMGNHEERYDLYLKGAKYLRDVDGVKLKEFLRLDEYGVTLHPRSGFEVVEGLYAFHGETVRQHSGQSAMGELDRWGTNGVSGHVHRLCVFYRRLWSGVKWWVEGGCLCGLDPSYMSRAANWMQGFVLVHSLPGGVLVPELVSICGGVCVFRGRVYSA